MIVNASSPFFGGKKSEFSVYNTFYHLRLDDSAVCQQVVGTDLTSKSWPRFIFDLPM